MVGSNSGQNVGDSATLSGTIGAARFAAQQGVAGVTLIDQPVDDMEAFVNGFTSITDLPIEP